MTVYIEKPAINLREELADLRNQGTYQEQQFWYENLVTNGTFDTVTTGWTAGGGASLSSVGGRLRVDGAGGIAYQSITTVAGRTYVVDVDAYTPDTPASAGVYIDTDATYGGSYASDAITGGIDGPITITFVAQSATTFIQLRQNTGTAGYVEFDNISVYESDGTDIVHRLPKGWKPKDVFEDGSLQREGAAYDYDVVYDGFDYFVKPAVAPGATTQTCVIGVKA